MLEPLYMNAAEDGIEIFLGDEKGIVLGRDSA